MNLATPDTQLESRAASSRVEPACAAFGECGGCRYQDLPYARELERKQDEIRALLIDGLRLDASCLEPITPSPQEYGYRQGLDMTFIRTKLDGKKLLGFMKERNGRSIVTVDACPIAVPAIDRFVPALREEAAARLPAGKRLGNLVVKASGDGRVRWGGIGHGSLKLLPEDFLWVEIGGKRIYFSLDTFFQANIGILPLVTERMAQWVTWDPERTEFFDLYSGVGLFGFLMAERARRVVMIEWVGPSVACARHTRERGVHLNVEIWEGKVEAEFPKLLARGIPADAIALVDPPRRGMSKDMLEAVATAPGLETLFYLSCGPDSLKRDLADFLRRGWRVEKIAPFDFFPKTKHIETLVLLKK